MAISASLAMERPLIHALLRKDVHTLKERSVR